VSSGGSISPVSGCSEWLSTGYPQVWWRVGDVFVEMLLA
jgi:hypothetical protein